MCGIVLMNKDLGLHDIPTSPYELCYWACKNFVSSTVREIFLECIPDSDRVLPVFTDLEKIFGWLNEGVEGGDELYKKLSQENNLDINKVVLY